MKYHLRANKGTNGQQYYSRCAARTTSASKVNRNHRDVYQNIQQERIVQAFDFKDVPADQRCAHCMDQGLIARNAQRRAKGLPPVKHLFEGYEYSQ